MQFTEPKGQPRLPDRSAVRFLLDHRNAELVTQDSEGRRFVTAVEYEPDKKGGFITRLPAQSEHASALIAGGRTELLVNDEQDEAVASPADEHGLLKAAAIGRVGVDVAVSAEAEAEQAMAQHEQEIDDLVSVRLQIRTLRVDVKPSNS